MFNKELSLKIMTIAILISTIFFNIGGVSVAEADSLFDTAPLNAKFQNYIENPKDEPIFDDAGNYFGFIPLPFQQERHINKTAILKSSYRLKGSSAASVYDMRDPNNDGDNSDSLLPPVKFQGNCGSCWSFASLDVLETHLKIKNVNYDFSENSLINKHRFDLGPCEGGNIIFTSAYMASYRGMIPEQDDSYTLPISGNYCSTCKPTRYIDNTILIPVRYDIDDNQYIKELIVEHGALYTSIYYSNDSYHPSSATYYYNDINNSFDDSNHAVVIVGWDDNKFVEDINKKGAFIVKNSWGKDWGEDGYFYVSYYDESIALSTLAYFDDKDSSELKFNKVYQHDEIGWIGGAIAADSGWGANWFVPEANAVLNAVSFAAANSNLSYKIVIYDDRSESDDSIEFSNVVATQTGNIEHKGWYTIPLTKSINLTKGNGFAVAVHFTTIGKNYPVPVESKIEGFSSNIKINEGESYVSKDGQEWFDTYNIRNPYTVCIKALVQLEEVIEEQECQKSPSSPEISIIVNGTKADIAWQEDSYCSGTSYNLYYSDYPYMQKSSLIHMGNKTFLSKNFDKGSAFYVVVYAKNTKGYAFSSVKSFEIKCPDKQICSTNKQFTDSIDSIEKDQNTIDSNWDIVTMPNERGVEFINDFYISNPDYEKHIIDMGIILSKERENLLHLQKSVWIYQIIKQIPHSGDLYFSNEILTSKGGYPALATADEQGNRGLTFYANLLPYGGSGFITAIKEADCISYYFFEFNGLTLSGKYQQKWCDAASDDYQLLVANKIATPITISFINTDNINIENITGENLQNETSSHIKLDSLFPSMGKSVDIYIAIHTPSGDLLFMDNNGDITNEFGKAFKVANTNTVRNTFLFKQSLFPLGIYTIYWLIAPTNDGDINSINFDYIDYILGAVEFKP
ncbi:MAG: hypothetical protein HQK64_03255 [Desulfamplus sp.]|nr:hypothetical protein [Desulfamplus sp.]